MGSLLGLLWIKILYSTSNPETIGSPKTESL